MQPPPTGGPFDDPARPSPGISRRRSAAGNGTPRVHRHYRGRQRRHEPPAGSVGLREVTTKRPLRIHPDASQKPSRRRRHRPQYEIPIATDCGPRVPAWEAFVRLPAPETLHQLGHWAQHSSLLLADGIGSHTEVWPRPFRRLDSDQPSFFNLHVPLRRRVWSLKHLCDCHAGRLIGIFASKFEEP